MNDILFDQKIAAAFATLPPADAHLKARLLRLPEEQAKPAPRRFASWKLIPPAAAVTAAALAAVVILRPGITPPSSPELPLIPYGGMFGDGGGLGGMGGAWHKSADEMHRDSPAYGREDKLGTMPVYRNPNFGKGQQLDEATAMEIAEKFGKALGKTFVYVPDPSWAEMEAKIKAENPLKWQDMQEMLDANQQNEWKFQCGEENLRVYDYQGIGVSLDAPLPDGLPKGDGTAARYEAMCRQVYEPYAAAVAAVTGLHFNKISTAMTGYDIYGDKLFETFLYANKSGDPLAKQAEDFALRRLSVSVLEEKEEVNIGHDHEGNAVESVSYQEPKLYLGFGVSYPGETDLIGNYPVMNRESAWRELQAGNCEFELEISAEELARAVFEDAELVYVPRPWLSTWLPMYRFTVSFPPDMQDWSCVSPDLAGLGLRSCYDFYVPAVPAEYLVPQETDDSVPRFAG